MKEITQANNDHDLSESAADYEGYAASGRFRVTPSYELPDENFGDRSSLSRLQNSDRADLYAESQIGMNDPTKLVSPEARIEEPFFRFVSPNSLNGVSFSPGVDSGLPIFPSAESGLKTELGRDNLAFGAEGVDSISPISPKSRTQQRHWNNEKADGRIQRRRIDPAQPVNRGVKRPASLHLDNSIQRSSNLDRVNTNPNVSSNGSMVLQLVLPQGALRDFERESQPSNSPNFSSVTDLPNVEYYTYAPTVVGYGNGSEAGNGDIQSPKSLRLKRGFSSSGSLHSEAVSSRGHYPPPSSSEDKTRMFRRFISINLSCTYAVFLVPLGLVVYIADLLIEDLFIAAPFNLYLVLVGFLYLIFLFFDIRSYVNKEKKYLKATTNYDKDDDATSVDPNVIKNISAPNHSFCFATGRHAGSIYLRIGATVFCFGHLIHSGLILAYEVLFLTIEEFYECFSPVVLSFDLLYPVYSFFLLFFIYKYSNVIINHCKETARLLIMHTIAASLCFWINAIFRESIDSLARYANSTDSEVNATLRNRVLQDHFNGSELYKRCQQPTLNVIYDTYSPYLYPFTIEYSILIVGILYVIWDNIGNCRRESSPLADVDVCPPSAGPLAGSNIVVYANCHHANRGLFAGLLMLIFSTVSIILFFVAFSNEDYVEVGKLVNNITELTLLTVATIAASLAYQNIVKLDINYHPTSLLDDILLFITIPAFFLYALFSMLPAIQKKDWFKITTLITELVQVLVQTPLIIDGLRRCSNAKKLRSKMPGRELITFLIICNVTMWIIETFEIKSTDKKDYRYEFYGVELWTILKHMTVPLTMFYRFHSSVCFADIWKSAYKPGELHH